MSLILMAESAMNVGYARTSTVEQKAGFDAQVRDLRAAGCCERDIYREQVSSVAERPELELVLSRVLREGDTLIVTKLDRLARSVADLVAITGRLKMLGAGLKVLDSPIDTASPYGELVLNVLGAIAQFEREIMLARQREGIAAAKAEGKYKGRAPTARAKADNVRRLAAEGVGKAEIARRLDIGERSVYRILAD
jgi:DNA invertase Pin-like site-specific DNA recombinase